MSCRSGTWLLPSSCLSPPTLGGHVFPLHIHPSRFIPKHRVALVLPVRVRRRKLPTLLCVLWLMLSCDAGSFGWASCRGRPLHQHRPAGSHPDPELERCGLPCGFRGGAEAAAMVGGGWEGALSLTFCFGTRPPFAPHWVAAWVRGRRLVNWCASGFVCDVCGCVWLGCFCDSTMRLCLCVCVGCRVLTDVKKSCWCRGEAGVAVVALPKVVPSDYERVVQQAGRWCQ
jgi:hypothetical protein